MRRLALCIALVTLGLVTPAVAQQQASRRPLAAPLVLVDAQGRVVSTADFRGKWLLIYFGYTSCSDLCPSALTTMSVALDEISPADRHVQPLFVTIDPERDHGPLLQAFTAAFDKRFVGLGGSVDAVRIAAEALGVSFKKAPKSDGDYSMDHSSVFCLIDPAGGASLTLSESAPHQLAARLIAELERGGAALDGVPLGTFR